MMNEYLTAILSSPALLVRWGVVGVVALVFVFFVSSLVTDSETTARPQRPNWAEIDHAVSGHSVKLESDERLNYAGIRTPYANEPFHEEALRRNAQLINDRKVRLRFDARVRDRKDRWVAYVFAEDEMVNEVLVREGLAFVRLTPDTHRFSDRLLAAQREARKKKRSLWAEVGRSNERSYPADPKYGNFHRPSCKEVEKIKADRLVTFGKKSQAFDTGLSPCSKCLP